MTFSIDRCVIGDCRDVLKTVPEGTFHCCVTSPPYWGLRDYGVAGQLGLERTPQEYIEKMVEVFREVRRVLREDGTLWLNLGDSYAGSWGAQSREHAGKHAPNISQISANQAKAAQIRSSGTGSLSRTPGLKAKDMVGIPWRVAFALQADGWYLRSDIIWHKPNPMPESVTDRPTKAHEYLFLMSKSDRYYYDANAIAEKATGREPGNVSHKGTAAYADGNEHHRTKGGLLDVGARETRNRRTVWTVATHPFSEAHFATFPPKLIEPCILAGSPIGGNVLDCFIGSGTTGEVCERLGRHWFGCEINPEYGKLAASRTAQIGLKPLVRP